MKFKGTEDTEEAVEHSTLPENELPKCCNRHEGATNSTTQNTLHQRMTWADIKQHTRMRPQETSGQITRDPNVNKKSAGE